MPYPSSRPVVVAVTLKTPRRSRQIIGGNPTRAWADCREQQFELSRRPISRIFVWAREAVRHWPHPDLRSNGIVGIWPPSMLSYWGAPLLSRLWAIYLESVFGSYVFDHSKNVSHTLWRTKSIHPEFCSTGVLREFALEGSQFRSCVLAVNGRLHLLSKKADAQIDRGTPMPTLHIVPLLPKGQIL